MSHDAVLDAKFGQKRNPDIIYQCYQPINVTELREYMLFCISRDVQASIRQAKEEEEEATNILVTNDHGSEKAKEEDPRSPVVGNKMSMTEESPMPSASKGANSFNN